MDRAVSSLVNLLLQAEGTVVLKAGQRHVSWKRCETASIEKKSLF